MNLWPNSLASNAALCGAEGELVAARISVEPRLLERLLDVLANLTFPVNPQLYHNAAVVYVYPDGRNAVHPTTIVEFPAFSGRLDEVRAALGEAGFNPASLSAKNMLEDIKSDCDVEPAPPEAPYVRVLRYKHALPH